MRTLLMAAAMAGALCAAPALAEDNEAGVPLTPAEAAGVWTVSTGGRDVCKITMTASHGVEADPGCSDVLPGGLSAWQPTHDGMALTGGAGAIGFHRWSNSLFVSQRASHLDIQLRRGGPVPPGD